MELGSLYGFVLALVLTGMLVGVGMVVIDKFANTAGLSSNVVTAINNTNNSIDDIPNTWLPVIVVAVVGAIIIGILVKSFGGGAR